MLMESRMLVLQNLPSEIMFLRTSFAPYHPPILTSAAVVQEWVAWYPLLTLRRYHPWLCEACQRKISIRFVDFPVEAYGTLRLVVHLVPTRPRLSTPNTDIRFSDIPSYVLPRYLSPFL